jgi:dihydrofolate reductase
VIGGRGTFDAADRWGGSNPWPVPFFVLTHRPPTDIAPDSGFQFVGDLGRALELAREAAADKEVQIMGGAEVIREALAAGMVDELSITIAPVILGAGKRLFDGFDQSLDLAHLQTWQSPLATHINYRVTR